MKKLYMEKIKEKAYWWFDYICGSEVYEAYKMLKVYDEMPCCDPEISCHHKAELSNLLQHAVQTTIFYGNLKKEGICLNKCPVVNRQIINSSREKFISSAYKTNKMHVRKTSGSTGTPFICYQNREKWKRVKAEIIYYSEKAGYRVGKRLINLRVVDKKSIVGNLKERAQNKISIDVGTMDDHSIKQLLNKIRAYSKNEAMILAYASIFDTFRDYFSKVGLSDKYNIYGMVSGSEFLFDDTRKLMEEAFECRCYSRYSNQENGVLGQDDGINNVFIINEAHYFVEVLEFDRDAEVGNGEIGRIVVTDLYNYAMPLIRYDTGDIGSLTFIDVRGVKKRAINNFGGRKIDMIFNSYGKYLSPHKISVLFRSYPEIKQYQFIQKNYNEYEAKIVNNGIFKRENDLRFKLLLLLGDRARLVFNYVDKIEQLDSSKRNYIKNELTNTKG